MILSHRIALNPSKAQAGALARASGTARFTWNWGLARWKELYAQGEKPKASEIKKEWNRIKREQFPWVYESPKNANQQPFADLHKAFQRFFKKKAGYPQFKRRGVHDSFYLSNDKVRLDGRKIRLSSLGWVRTHERLRFDGKIMSVTVSRTANRWFASVAVDLGEDYSRPRHDDKVVGVDLGVNEFVLSDGRRFATPKPLKKALAALRRANRIHSRRQRGSRRREQARVRLAKAHARVASVRNDFLHKLSTTICRESQAVVVEDLCVRGMVRGLKGLRRSVSDAGFREFRRQLEYKAPLHGTELVVADRFFPSSKTCSACGKVKGELSLGEREFVCEACGFAADRDLNAAMNLRALGQRVSARGGDVRPRSSLATTGAAPVKRELGTRPVSA